MGAQYSRCMSSVVFPCTVGLHFGLASFPVFDECRRQPGHA